jgi:hypothetical protein
VLSLFLSSQAPLPASAFASVQPDRLQTLSSANIFFTVLNARNSLLYNITMMLPSSLGPVGYYSGSGRWVHTLTHEGSSLRIAWFGGPVQPNQSVVFGVAVIVPADTGTYNSTITENYQGNVTESSSLQLIVYCPCVLAIDVRSLSYSLVVLVLVLPLLEVILGLTHLIRDGKRQAVQ